MKRTSGKIKDYVDAQAFDAVGNFAADPARSLAAYRFTEATAELLARWLDALAELPRKMTPGIGVGSPATHAVAGRTLHNRALAGPRGAGKSHALAAFLALVAHAELRPTVADAHVSTSARRLALRRFTIVRVERGTHATFEQELVAALDRALGVSFASDALGFISGNSTANLSPAGAAGQRFAALLAVAASRVADAPLVFTIDTAYGRSERVARDDGAELVELARAARGIGAFVLLALDDDIEGADGANVALGQTFQIEYLDPEHLLRVAETHVLRKTAQSRVGLREIYIALREAVPGFNWSEAKFSALYPVHPVVADAASAVRLYAPAFALLPFAAEATPRAAGRPSASLISLDEVFDRAEYDLRRAAPLAEVFAAYDDLSHRAIAQLPVMARLRARLILKALFVFSLDGRGATAADICTAMLFEEEGASGEVERATEEALMLFAALPAADNRAPCLERELVGGSWRYRFLINAAQSFENCLRAAIEESPFDSATLNRILHVAARRHFAELPAADDTHARHATVEMFLPWRGTHRAGQFVHLASIAKDTGGELFTNTDAAAKSGARSFEWRVLSLGVELGEQLEPASAIRLAENLWGDDSIPAQFTYVWRPASPTDAELALLRRFAALDADEKLRNEFAEETGAAYASTAAEVERIWTRLYLDEGELTLLTNASSSGGEPCVLLADSFALLASARRFTYEARAAATLTQSLALMFDAAFSAFYTQHPVFPEPLGEREVTGLAVNLFGGVNIADAQAQRDAETFALPLGLVTRRERQFVLATNDELLAHTHVQVVLQKVLTANSGQTVALDAIADVLGRAPYGFSLEAQRLVLAALVANRQLEFVTPAGERLTRRALGTTLKWMDVAGVVRASGITTSVEELTAWGRLLASAEGYHTLSGATATQAAFDEAKSGNTIAEPATREMLRQTLTNWFATWTGDQTLERCEALPDAWLTIKSATLMQAVRRNFGVAAAGIETMLSGDIELEEGLQRIADAFASSPAIFAEAARQLLELKGFADSFERGETRRRYLLGIEPIPEAELDGARLHLLALTNDDGNHKIENSAFDQLWNDFLARYADLYVARHTAHFNADEDQRLLDHILRGESWRETESLAEFPALGDKRLRRLRHSLRRRTQSRCLFTASEVRSQMQTAPLCICGFRLRQSDNSLDLARELEAAVLVELDNARRTLTRLAPHLTESLTAYVAIERDDARAETARRLAARFATGHAPVNLTSAEIAVMRDAIEAHERHASPPPLRINLPVSRHELLTPAELDARVRQWLDELPHEAHIVEVSDEQETTHGAPQAV